MVDTIQHWQAIAAELGRHVFEQRFSHLFLLRKPEDTDGSSDAPGIAYETALSTPFTFEPLEEVSDEWIIAEICKRPGNPFPDRVSIGRARNCDIVLRFPFISKLHAHFFVAEDGSLQLHDRGSSNGTTVNGRRLEKDAMVPIQRGDVLGFGALELQVGNAADLYDLLTEEKRGDLAQDVC